jgi:hypothetical protein
VAVALFGLFIGSFVFRTIVAICICGVVSSIIGFLNAYYVTYKICFKQSAWPIFRYSISPLLFFLIVGVAGYWLIPDLEGVHFVVSLIIKTSLWFIATVVFWQFFTPFKPKEYFNVVTIGVMMLGRGKTTGGHHASCCPPLLLCDMSPRFPVKLSAAAKSTVICCSLISLMYSV